MFVPRLGPNPTAAFLISHAPSPNSQLATLHYHFLTAEAPLFFAALAVRAGDFGSTTHDHALLLFPEA
jgi:hypothetical protein